MPFNHSIPLPNNKNFKDLTGLQFSLLSVVSLADKIGEGKTLEYLWNCQCECGATKIIRGHSLKRGLTRACGSLIHRQHGASNHNSPIHQMYTIWRGMIKRCIDRNSPAFENYGGRGIYVCEEWRNSFKRFLSDMGNRPSAEHSVDRRDNDGPYAPWNCRWATRIEQARNRRQRKPMRRPSIKTTGTCGNCGAVFVEFPYRQRMYCSRHCARVKQVHGVHNQTRKRYDRRDHSKYPTAATPAPATPLNT
jgi:hypothetical protein